METKTVSTTEPNALMHASDVLRHGGVVAFPTDTVYGLGVMAFEEDGIMRLYLIKGRNHTKAIAILISGIEDLERVADSPSKETLALAEHFWPGPLTLVVPRHPNVPDILSPTATIGVRVPDHPVALELLEMVGPLAVTSANLSEEKNSVTAKNVLEQLGGRVHLTLDGGKTPGGMPSTVVDCSKPEIEILRPGPLKQKELLSVLS